MMSLLSDLPFFPETGTAVKTLPALQPQNPAAPLSNTQATFGCVPLCRNSKSKGRPTQSYPYLKDSLAQIAQLIGINNLIRLVRWNNKRKRNHHLYIPLWAQKNHPIAALIGHQALQKLSVEFGGTLLRLPADGRMVAAKHTVAALVAAYPHKSMTEIALLARSDKSVVHEVFHSMLHQQYQQFLPISQDKPQDKPQDK